MNTFDNPALFHQIFHGIPEAIAILDDRDRVLTVNTRFEQFFGYHADAIVGHCINDLVLSEEYRQQGEHYSKVVLEGTPLEVTATRARSDGTPVQVAISARPLYLEGRQAAIVVMYRDISEHVLLLDSVDTHIWYLKSPDRYGTVNEAHARFTGRRKEELDNCYLTEIFPRDEARRLRADNEEVFRSGKAATLERWTRRADGADRLLRITKKPWFDPHGRIKYVVCTAVDITNIHERDNTLRLLSSMVENSADPMIHTDAEYRITYMNPAAETFYGWTLEDVRGKSPGLFNAEENRDEIQRELWKTISGGSVYEGRLLNRRKDGTTYPAHIRIAPIFGRDKEIIGFVDVQRDVTTDQKALEARDLLLREVQHRVKNNLATVVSLLSLQTDQQDDPAVSNALSDTRRRIEAILTVYESLHDSEQTGTLDVDSYLRSLIERLAPSLTTRIPITYSGVADPPAPVESTVAISVGMIINELVTNAVKHAFPDAPADARIAVDLRRQDGTFRLRVNDNGVSLPVDVSAGGAGSGLGLTLVHSLVEKIEGTLGIDRAGGTTFTICLPAASDKL